MEKWFRNIYWASFGRIESVDENGRLCNKETKIKFQTDLLQIQEKIIDKSRV